MVDKVVKYEGSGLTRHRIESDKPETWTAGDSPEKLAAALRAFREMPNPWDMNQPFFDWLEAQADEVRRSQPDPRDQLAWGEYYKPRHTRAWYVREMSFALAGARSNAAKGDVKWAMYHAMKLGGMHAEAKIKFAHEGMWQWGVDERRKKQRGGEATRKHPVSVSVACYERYRAQGHNITDATYLASQELNVSMGTIRNARKEATASD